MHENTYDNNTIELNDIGGHFCCSIQSFVVKPFTYSINFKKIKKLLRLSNQKYSMFDAMNETDLVKGQLFHDTGIDNGFNIFHYTPAVEKNKKLLEKYNKANAVIYQIKINIDTKQFILSNIRRLFRNAKESIAWQIKSMTDDDKNEFGNLFYKVFGSLAAGPKSFFEMNKRKFEELTDLVRLKETYQFKIIDKFLKDLKSLTSLFYCFKEASIDNFPVSNIYLVVGINNVATICFETNYLENISNKFLSSLNCKQYIFDKCKKIKRNICKDLDGYIDAFNEINFDNLLGLSDVFTKLKKKGETRRTVFVKITQDKNNFINVSHKTLVMYNKNIALFYNLLCTSICYYRSISYASIAKRTESNQLFTKKNSLKERINWINNERSGSIINKAPISDSENFFIDYTTFVYGYAMPFYQMIDEKKKNKKDYEELFESNHHLRYRAAHIYYSIVSSIIYSSMLLCAGSLLKIYLNALQKHNSFLIRIPSIKNYTSVYNKTLSTYNNYSLNQNHEKIIFYHKIYEALKIEERMADINVTSNTLWHDANTNNGFVLPMVQTIITIIGFICLMQFSFSKFFWCLGPWILLVSTASLLAIITLLFTIINLISKSIIDRNRLPSSEKYICFCKCCRIYNTNKKRLKSKKD